MSVPTPPIPGRPAGGPSFPQVAVAAIVAGFSVAVVQRIDDRAGWFLAVILVLGMLMFYPGARDGLSDFLKTTMGG